MKSVRAAVTGGVWPVPTHSAAAGGVAAAAAAADGGAGTGGDGGGLPCHTQPIGRSIVSSLFSLTPPPESFHLL